MNQVLSPSLTLPALAVGTGSLFECFAFEDGSALWGSVRRADVQIAGETASNIPIQIIGDSPIPNACQGSIDDDVALFGANGLLGVGIALQDCGAACSSSDPDVNPGSYFVCASSGCQPAALFAPASLAQQVSNPVANFTTDSNGVIMRLPAIPDTGTTSVSGTLVFGIGTQSNNSLGSAQVFHLNSFGYITTVVGGVSYVDSRIHSGSAGIFFGESNTSLPESNGFYCPKSSQNFTAQIQDTNGATGSISFSVGNACGLLSPLSGNFAFNNLAGPNSDSAGFDWGLPFFFGRDVYTAIEGRATPAGPGAYFAYKPGTAN
jgi:hypothetical protein